MYNTHVCSAKHSQQPTSDAVSLNRPDDRILNLIYAILTHYAKCREKTHTSRIKHLTVPKPVFDELSLPIYILRMYRLVFI